MNSKTQHVPPLRSEMITGCSAFTISFRRQYPFYLWTSHGGGWSWFYDLNDIFSQIPSPVTLTVPWSGCEKVTPNQVIFPREKPSRGWPQPGASPCLGVLKWSCRFLAKAGLAQSSFPLLPVSPRDASAEFQHPCRQGQIKLLLLTASSSWAQEGSQSPQPQPCTKRGKGIWALVCRE